MKIKIKPSPLFGTVSLPPSKSHTIRALFLGALCEGVSSIENPLISADCAKAIVACESIGAKIEQKGSLLKISGVGGVLKGAKDVIDSGNSGLVLRFMGALGGLSSLPFVITGDESIRLRRPVSPLLEGLKQWGASAFSLNDNNHAPIFVQGPLKGGKATIDGADSQPVSALLIAAAFSSGSFELIVQNPGEKPWVSMTLSWLEKLGVTIRHKDFEFFTIEGKSQRPSFHTKIPGDLSACAFPVVSSLITKSSLKIENVDFQDNQGDKNFFIQLMKSGVKTEINEKEKTLFVPSQSPFQGGIFDVNDWIDAVPILSVLACFGTKETRITNATIAKKKESDRLHAMAQELKKMGGRVNETSDGLLIAPSQLKGASLFSHHDHRVAMALTVAALAANSESEIDGGECISKSYPDFLVDLRAMGAKVECD